jgi:hypothetical protein
VTETPTNNLGESARSEPESYAFVTNVNRLTDADSYNLVSGHELRRAKTEEIAFIKETLRSVGPAPQVLYQHFWEQVWPSAPGPPVLLPEDQWRHFVIAFKRSNQTLSKLEQAFD